MGLYWIRCLGVIKTEADVGLLFDDKNGADFGAGSIMFNLPKRLNRLNRYEENEASWSMQIRFSIAKDEPKDFKLSLSF